MEITPQRLQLAQNLAAFVHVGQTRRMPEGHVPYIQHPISVFTRLMSWGVVDRSLLVAGLLHDTVEDAPARVSGFFNLASSDDAESEALNAISNVFGARVAEVVRGVTNRHDVPYLEHVAHAIEDPGVFVVKLSDFFDNAMMLIPGDPATSRLEEKYSPLFPLFEQRLRTGDDVHALLPGWPDVLREIQLRMV